MTTVSGTIRKKYVTEEMATVCRECGRKFRMLGKHVSVHGMSVREYKLKHGLPLSVGLVCGDTFDKMSDHKTKMFEEGHDLFLKLRLANPPGAHRGAKRGPPEGALSANIGHRADKYRDERRRLAREKWELRKQRFVELWFAGVPLKQMANEFGCSYVSIRNWARTWGLPRKKMVFVMDSEAVK